MIDTLLVHEFEKSERSSILRPYEREIKTFFPHIEYLIGYKCPKTNSFLSLSWNNNIHNFSSGISMCY